MAPSFILVLLVAFSAAVGFLAMPRKHSAEALRLRRQRAVHRGYVTAKPRGTSHVLVAGGVKEPVKVMAAAAALRHQLDAHFATSHQFLRDAIFASKPHLTQSGFKRALDLNKKAGLAKHGLSAAHRLRPQLRGPAWADFSDDDFPPLLPPLAKRAKLSDPAFLFEDAPTADKSVSLPLQHFWWRTSASAAAPPAPDHMLVSHSANDKPVAHYVPTKRVSFAAKPEFLYRDAPSPRCLENPHLDTVERELTACKDLVAELGQHLATTVTADGVAQITQYLSALTTSAMAKFSAGIGDATSRIDLLAVRIAKNEAATTAATAASASSLCRRLGPYERLVDGAVARLCDVESSLQHFNGSLMDAYRVLAEDVHKFHKQFVAFGGPPQLARRPRRHPSPSF